MATIFLLSTHMTLPSAARAAGQSEAKPVLRVFGACLGSLAEYPTEAVRTMKLIYSAISPIYGDSLKPGYTIP